MWLNAVKRNNSKPTRRSRVCSAHFTDDDYQILPGVDRRLLKMAAGPLEKTTKAEN